MQRLIFFDIDGTLTRTRNGYLPFNEAILKTLGVAGDIRSVIPDGNTDPLILKEIFANAATNVKITGAHWDRFARQLCESYTSALREGLTKVAPIRSEYRDRQFRSHR